MVAIAHSIIDQEAGIAKATFNQQTGSFDRWKRFLSDMGFEDEWLEGHNRASKTHLLCTFASMCRRNIYGKKNKTVLKGGTVKATVTHVRSTFRSTLRPDPALDDDAMPSLFLQRQIRGYIDADPSTRQQKALPISVFHQLLENKFTPNDEALGQLACGAFFFAMRSCEYLTVQGKRKTKRLKIANVRFFKSNVEIKDKRNALIKYADTVSITFQFQKNRQKDVTVTQPRSGKPLCPVLVWGKIVQRVLSYKGSTENSPVNTVLIGTKRHYLKANAMFDHLKHTVDNMKNLGFTGKDVGTHSIRSSLAMALYLAKRPVCTIMLIGRWCSDAFLLYVRRQVQEFSAGVSADMVNQEQFYTIPDLTDTQRLNPRTSNSSSLASTISLNGPNAATAHTKRTSLHVWH